MSELLILPIEPANLVRKSNFLHSAHFLRDKRCITHFYAKAHTKDFFWRSGRMVRKGKWQSIFCHVIIINEQGIMYPPPLYIHFTHIIILKRIHILVPVSYRSYEKKSFIFWQYGKFLYRGILFNGNCMRRVKTWLSGQGCGSGGIRIFSSDPGNLTPDPHPCS